MSRDVDILIPTASRPEMLEHTLNSIQRQTAIGRVKRILVSENLGDARSGEVCNRFTHIPIDYVLREPKYPSMMEHVQQLFLEADAEYVAFVCDDDLWMPGHLETGLRTLESNPDAVGCFSGFIAGESELSPAFKAWAPSLLWLAAGMPSCLEERSYDLESVLALCWVLTPFQWSTMVAHSDALRRAAPALTSGPHFFYGDRLLIMELAAQGELAFNPGIDVLYRVYGGNWSSGQEVDHLEQLLDECMEIVERRSREIGLVPAAMWRKLLSSAPEEILADASDVFRARFSDVELQRHSLQQLLPRTVHSVGFGTRCLGRFRRELSKLLHTERKNS